MDNSSPLISLLAARRGTFAPILDHDLNAPDVARLDFTNKNKALAYAELRDTAAFGQLVQQMLQTQNATIGVGGYFENRVIYRRSQHFDSTSEARSLHLGVDIWAPAHLPLYAPLAGTVHSFQDNDHFGDYGPTLILQHELAGITFYTLYGHLSRASLHGYFIGKSFAPREQIATMGPYPENGDWPPHLHFQVITDLKGNSGDFPGVCAPSEEAFYRKICLDPNLLLTCRHLE